MNPVFGGLDLWVHCTKNWEIFFGIMSVYLLRHLAVVKHCRYQTSIIFHHHIRPSKIYWHTNTWPTFEYFSSILLLIWFSRVLAVGILLDLISASENEQRVVPNTMVRHKKKQHRSIPCYASGMGTWVIETRDRLVIFHENGNIIDLDRDPGYYLCVWCVDL